MVKVLIGTFNIEHNREKALVGAFSGLLTAAQRFVDSSSVDQMTHSQIMDILFINIIYYPVTVSYMTVYG